tara:strand:+ start:525 stop:854 length:330 start_codon:yes stop_codon:yes gene_type:complete
MKKLTMSVAALSLALTSYGQCSQECLDSINNVNYNNNVRTFQEIDNRIDDIIDAIRMDMFYGRITRDNGMYYVNEVMKLKSINEDLVADLFTHRIERVEINCENCDEID